MAIKQVIDDSKARLDALLAYANGVTGASDVSIGDAVKTLSDGYGQGGANEIKNQFFSVRSMEIVYEDGDRIVSNTKDLCDWMCDKTGVGVNNILGLVVNTEHRPNTIVYGMPLARMSDYPPTFFTLAGVVDVARYRNGNYSKANWNSTTYDASVNVGDSYTVYIVE